MMTKMERALMLDCKERMKKTAERIIELKTEASELKAISEQKNLEVKKLQSILSTEMMECGVSSVECQYGEVKFYNVQTYKITHWDSFYKYLQSNNQTDILSSINSQKLQSFVKTEMENLKKVDGVDQVSEYVRMSVNKK